MVRIRCAPLGARLRATVRLLSFALTENPIVVGLREALHRPGELLGQLLPRTRLPPFVVGPAIGAERPGAAGDLRATLGGEFVFYLVRAGLQDVTKDVPPVRV